MLYMRFNLNKKKKKLSKPMQSHDLFFERNVLLGQYGWFQNPFESGSPKHELHYV